MPSRCVSFPSAFTRLFLVLFRRPAFRVSRSFLFFPLVNLVGPADLGCVSFFSVAHCFFPLSAVTFRRDPPSDFPSIGFFFSSPPASSSCCRFPVGCRLLASRDLSLFPSTIRIFARSSAICLHLRPGECLSQSRSGFTPGHFFPSLFFPFPCFSRRIAALLSSCVSRRVAPVFDERPELSPPPLPNRSILLIRDVSFDCHPLQPLFF